MTALLLALVLQDSARELIDRLQSDEPAVREEATRKLAAMGKAAEPELRKAADHPEAEVAGRVRKLLRNLEISDALTPRLKSAMPGVLPRLLSEQPHEWTAVFLQAQPDASLRRDDLEALAARALRGAANVNELTQVLMAVQVKGLRSASPEVAKLLPHPQVGYQAFAAYRMLEGRRAIPVFAGLLRHEFDQTRLQALDSLVELDAVESIPEVRGLLKDNSPTVRTRAARAYARLAGREAVAELRAMAKDSNPDACAAGLQGLAATGLKEVGPDVLDGLKHSDTSVQGVAAGAAAELRLKDAFPRIAAMLKSEDEGLRYDALSAVEQYGTRAAAKALLPLLSDKDEDIRDEAFYTFARIGIREGTGEIAKLLESKDTEVRVMAMELLAILGDGEVFDELAKGLKDASSEIQSTAIYTLGALDPARAVRILVPLLGDKTLGEEVESWIYDAVPKEAIPELKKMLEAEKDEKVRERIQDLLVDVFETEPREVSTLLEDKDPRVRAAALSTLHAADLAPLVVGCLKDKEPEVRFAAVGALERMKSKEVRQALSDADPEVLCAAIRAVAALELKDAARDVLGLLKSPSGLVRQEAAEAMGALGAEEAAPALIEMARSPLPYPRASAARGLAGLKGPEARAAVAELQKDPHPYVRRSAAGPVSAVPELTTVPELSGALGDPNREIVRSAARALMEMGTKESVVAAVRGIDLREAPVQVEAPGRLVPWIAELLDDPDDLFRDRAAWALSALGTRESVPPLVERLGARNSASLMLALGELDARESIPKIVPFLAHRRELFRLQAAETLGRLRAREAEAELLERLDDPSMYVRRSAALALGSIGSERAIPKLMEMLGDEDQHAAAALCLLGRREGAPVLIAAADEAVRTRGGFFNNLEANERPSLLFALNALRAPELRRRLESTKLTALSQADLPQLGARIAAQAGLAFEAPRPERLHLGIHGPLHAHTLWSVLFEAAVTGIASSGEFETILDEGKLRQVDLDDAVRFWKAWYRESSK